MRRKEVEGGGRKKGRKERGRNGAESSRLRNGWGEGNMKKGETGEGEQRKRWDGNRLRW